MPNDHETLSTLAILSALQRRAFDLRIDNLTAITAAASGHPGGTLSAMDILQALFFREMRHRPNEPHWPERDRFVLSNGHGSMLLYSVLHLSGYELGIEELKRFRQLGSRTAGHPERQPAMGVETTTGPLGQGLANAVGMALAERLMADEFNRPEHTIVDHHTYVLASDGDLMEGVASEACSLAGHLGLGKLIVLYDDNRVTLAGSTPIAWSPC